MFNKTENSESLTKRPEKKSTFVRKNNFKPQNYYKFALMIFLLATTTYAIDSYSVHVLNHGIIQAHVILPDRSKPYYEGARFESAGFISKLLYKGKNYFGKNYAKEHTPSAPDQVCGNAEDFQNVTGFQPGDTSFMKIGNGIFSNPDGLPLLVNGHYNVMTRFSWKWKGTDTSIEFFQKSINFKGYAYEYKKKITLIPRKPILQIMYSLKNIGSKDLKNAQYAHNFIAFDQKIPVGTKVIYPYVPKRKTNRTPPFIQTANVFKIIANSISFSKLSVPSDTQNNSVSVVAPDGSAILIEDKYQASAWALYTGKNVISPECFKPIILKPGKTETWQRTYTVAE
jgi:hypothetical protein